MATRMAHERQLLEEIKGLSSGEMARLLKLVHLVKEEFISPRRHAVAKESVLDFAGCLNDVGIDDMDVFDRAVSRRGLLKGRNLSL